MSFTPPPNEIYTIFSFFGFFMCIIPLPCHLKAWNAGTCLLMFWAGMGCFIFFVNSIVWHGNTSNTAPIWCDICTRIITGTFYGIPASSLCINRRLYLLQLDPGGNFAITKSDKIRSLTIDLGLSFGLPIIFMALQCVYQGRRFDIFEDIGCAPGDYNSWVEIFLLNIPPIILGLASATYGICAIISINKKRNQFKDVLARRRNITSSLYFRLMCYAGIEALSTTPIAVYFIVADLTMTPFYPWISWKKSHLGVHSVGQYPATVWHNLRYATAFEFTRWIHVFSAFLFFSVFGFAEGAKSHYRLVIKFFLELTGIRIGRQTEGSRSSMSQSSTAERLTDFSANPTTSIFSGRGGNRRSPGPLGTSRGLSHEFITPNLRDTQDYAGDQGSQTALAFPGKSLSNPHAPAVEQENEQMPDIRTTLNLRSFLSLGRNDPSPHFAQSEMDISTIEEGRPSQSNRHSSNQLSPPFRSFLNLN